MKKNKEILKIPSNVSTLYLKKKRILIVKGPLKTKSLNLPLEISINTSENTITISSKPFFRMSNAEKKKIKSLKNSLKAKIKHSLIESSTTIFQKLQIVGVGYRVDYNDAKNKNLLVFKLGYSHPLYLKVPKNLNLECLTKTKFYIFGNSYEEVNTFSAKIRAKKKPDVYKGKGLLYVNESPLLKEGKKV